MFDPISIRTISPGSAARLLLVAVLVAGCAGPGGASSLVPTSAPATPGPTPTPILVPTMATITPSVVIDVPGATGVIAVATDGETVWAATSGAILRIDTATNEVETLPAPTRSDDTVMAIASDGLWVARWRGGHVYRLDPQTGDVRLTIDFPAAVRIQFVDDELWVGREDTSTMWTVDRETGALGRSIDRGAYGYAALGDIWFAVDLTPRIERVDPDTGDVVATIDAAGESNCNLGGAFPDNAWLACFGRQVMPRSASRIDPATNALATVATLPPSHGGSVVVVDGQAWFVGAFEDAAGDSFVGLLLLNPRTGAIERFISAGPADPDTAAFAGGALWIPDEAGHRILRVDAADLSG